MAGIIEDGEVTIKFVAPLTISSNQPAFASDTLSLKRSVASQKSQRWEISTKLMPSNDSADYFVHSIISGVDKVFEIQVPQIFQRIRTTTATSLKVNTDTAASLDVVPVNCIGKIGKGELIKFSNHSKVYMVTETLNGNGYLKIYPTLRAPVTNGTIISFGDDTRMAVRQDTNNLLGITYIDGILSDPGTVKFIEAL